ncbi:maleylpyruvate isomerase family mycothiol-dependent enzyme [Micromonospora sp. 4G55]|uniref:maleylpyruvate isomerase family mycothiol-dependent enzyme n=1 Tax=Micromonospora sp. 4G55 TaxID=2806102 RepID=UPI001EE4CE5C|nr:maleylpyruvate isomerase family mycothiol-dependent enzyme [Micromonospora sp. 4G55]
MDLLETYRRSLAEFVDRVEQVAPGQWSDPTPCPDWDVRALVNHVVTEDRWTAPLLAGRTVEEIGDRFEGDQLGDDPIGGGPAGGVPGRGGGQPSGRTRHHGAPHGRGDAGG